MRRSFRLLLTAVLILPCASCLSWVRQQKEELSGTAGNNSSEGTAESELPASKTAEIFVSVGAQLEKKGEPAKALASYEQALKLDPSCGDRLAHRLAVLYDRTDQTSKAGPEYERAIQFAPKNAKLLNDFGYHWYCAGNWTEAEKYFRQALAIDARHTRARTNLGLTLAQQGRDEEALEAFEQVVGPAEAYSNLGFVLLARGLSDEARAAYKQALTFDPASRVARAALARLDGAPAAAETAHSSTQPIGGPSE
jgi:Tfp pilus assembly protein PilF